jgi:hypothetical protein
LGFRIFAHSNAPTQFSYNYTPCSILVLITAAENSALLHCACYIPPPLSPYQQRRWHMLPTALLTVATIARCSHGPRMALSQMSLQFEFPTIPYAAAIHHIHSPEHMAELHGLGAPLFTINHIHPPNVSSSPSITSISFDCSTIFMQNMQVSMFTSQPDVSNMLFFKDKRALYQVKLSVVPIKVASFLVFFLVLLACHRILTHSPHRRSCPIGCSSTSHFSRLEAPASAPSCPSFTLSKALSVDLCPSRRILISKSTAALCSEDATAMTFGLWPSASGAPTPVSFLTWLLFCFHL